MSKAVRQLETEQTKDALSHEMAALNGLLQAQAEVRRQQVMQQSNAAGSGGSNRADQDLSALFDKELQRQQRTNYETRPSVETQPDRAESNDAALDRIRDLARRQEDLNRRLADLAGANLNTEEMKRQLERLTREQAELRQQTEELLRRNGDQPSASSPGRSTQAAGGRGQSDPAQRDRQNALQGAIDQMRSAGSNLNRDEPRQAAANGQRAVEQLKRLEQQARRGGADRSGEAPSPEASQLAKQLEEARAIRNRVQRAEQQLREAEGRGRSGQGRPDTGTGRSAQADGQRADGGRGQGEAPTVPRTAAREGRAAVPAEPRVATVARSSACVTSTPRNAAGARGAQTSGWWPVEFGGQRLDSRGGGTEFFSGTRHRSVQTGSQQLGVAPSEPRLRARRVRSIGFRSAGAHAARRPVQHRRQ